VSALGTVLFMISSQRISGTVSASAMRERWQRHGTASEHINALRFCPASLINPADEKRKEEKI
jgi:hypothetical protein